VFARISNCHLCKLLRDKSKQTVKQATVIAYVFHNEVRVSVTSNGVQYTVLSHENYLTSVEYLQNIGLLCY